MFGKILKKIFKYNQRIYTLLLWSLFIIGLFLMIFGTLSKNDNLPRLILITIGSSMFGASIVALGENYIKFNNTDTLMDILNPDEYLREYLEEFQTKIYRYHITDSTDSQSKEDTYRTWGKFYLNIIDFSKSVPVNNILSTITYYQYDRNSTPRKYRVDLKITKTNKIILIHTPLDRDKEPPAVDIYPNYEATRRDNDDFLGVTFFKSEKNKHIISFCYLRFEKLDQENIGFLDENKHQELINQLSRNIDNKIQEEIDIFFPRVSNNIFFEVFNKTSGLLTGSEQYIQTLLIQYIREARQSIKCVHFVNEIDDLFIWHDALREYNQVFEEIANKNPPNKERIFVFAEKFHNILPQEAKKLMNSQKENLQISIFYLFKNENIKLIRQINTDYIIIDEQKVKPQTPIGGYRNISSKKNISFLIYDNRDKVQFYIEHFTGLQRSASRL